MTASDGTDDTDTDSRFVYCSSCGAKAPSSWSFCRNCESSLDDATPVAEKSPSIETDGVRDIQETGCPKCGHDDAEVDTIATTGGGLSRMFDIQTRQFRVVTCTNCGYSEFYRGQDADIIVDLFLG